MVKRRRRVKKKRVKKREATIRTEPVERRPLLGGGGSFSVIPANPFQESINNMMTSIQQNLNNNVNNTLNTLKSESQILHDRLMSLNYDQQKATEQGNQLMAVDLKQKIDDYAKVLDTKYGMMNQMENWMMKSLEFGQHGKMQRRRAPRKEIGEKEIKGTITSELEEMEHTEEEDESFYTPKVEAVERAGAYGRKEKLVPMTPEELKEEAHDFEEVQKKVASKTTEQRKTERRRKINEDVKNLPPEAQREYLNIVQNRLKKRDDPKSGLRPEPKKNEPYTPPPRSMDASVTGKRPVKATIGYALKKAILSPTEERDK